MNDASGEINRDSKWLSAVWTTPDRGRYFVIEDECNLSPGDFTLRTATGRKMQVSAEALAPYEVSKEEADEWLVRRAHNLLHEMKRRIKKLYGEFSRPKPADPQAAPQAELMDNAADLIQQLSAGLVERLRAEAEALRKEAVRPAGEAEDAGNSYRDTAPAAFDIASVDPISRRNGPRLKTANIPGDDSDG